MVVTDVKGYSSEWCSRLCRDAAFQADARG
jgi:hypothetical protein